MRQTDRQARWQTGRQTNRERQRQTEKEREGGEGRIAGVITFLHCVCVLGGEGWGNIVSNKVQYMWLGLEGNGVLGWGGALVSTPVAPLIKAAAQPFAEAPLDWGCRGVGDRSRTTIWLRFPFYFPLSVFPFLVSPFSFKTVVRFSSLSWFVLSKSDLFVVFGGLQ